MEEQKNDVINARHLARETAFQFLFRTETFENDQPVDFDWVERELERHFEHFSVPSRARSFARRLVHGTLERRQQLDETLENQSENWKITRMAWVDRNLLRMSIYELLFESDVPFSVTIDEAVEIAKKFGGSDSSPFVNGVLDAIAKNGRQAADSVPLPN